MFAWLHFVRSMSRRSSSRDGAEEMDKPIEAVNQWLDG